MHSLYYGLLIVLHYSNLLKADTWNKEPSNNVDLLSLYTHGNDSYPTNCSVILDKFADYASNFTKCSILHARPIKLCENCIEHYINFRNKYKELLIEVEDGTSCKSVFISQDRLDVILKYHDNILSIWNKGHCSACYDWTGPVPLLSNQTKRFNTKLNDTITCINKYKNSSKNDAEVCQKCMQDYLQLDNYYKSLSTDGIGVDSVCMDIVDSMNATRAIWSKTLGCCKIRRTPEIIFLCCAGIISALPLFYYIILRYCNPIRNFPNVLKQSRFKQTILRSLHRRAD